MTGAAIASRLATLIALGIAQSISLGIQQRVQRLLHATPDHAVEVALDPLIINRDDIAQWTRCSLSHGGSFLLSWLCLATSSSARFGAVSPIYLCERFCTLSSDGLVCGIAADANPYHSHYTYCQNSIHRKQSQPGPNYDHDYNLHSRDSAAVYVGRCSVGLHTAALAVLAT